MGKYSLAISLLQQTLQNDCFHKLVLSDIKETDPMLFGVLLL